MKLIALTQGKSAIVDDEDYERLSAFRWYAMRCCKRWYAVRKITIGKRRQRKSWMHREVLKTPDGNFTDHINGNGLDNRRANLREANHSQNQANRGPNSNNKSGFKGVYRRFGKWKAQITVNRRKIHIGHFTELSDAVAAYSQAARQHFGEYGT